MNDHEIFIVDEEDKFYLILNTDNSGWFVELMDSSEKVIFHYKCDTFITGNLIFHLKKAIKTFCEKHHKIVLSRWYPKTDPRFLISIDEPTYISTYIYKDEESEKCYVKFIVTEESTESPIVFIVSLKEIQSKII